jgi:hypothetical protein
MTAMIVPLSAWGQTEEDRAAARALATQGVSAFNEGRYSESFDRFSRAESLLHAPPHLLYLARSADKLGQLVRARELYLRLVREELPATAPQAFREAQHQAREEVRLIEPRLANVVISVKAREGVTVKVAMDGKPISSAILGVPIPVDPGSHEFSASADGYRSSPVKVVLVEGGKGSAELLLEPSPQGATSDAPIVQASRLNQTSGAAMAKPSPSPAREQAWMRPASYVAYGIGALGIGAGVFFGLDSRSKRNDADSAYAACKRTSGGCTTGDAESRTTDKLDNDARRSFGIALVGAALGVVGASAGTALLLLQPKRETVSAASLSPWVSLGEVGLTGTW